MSGPKPRATKPSRRTTAATYETVRELARALPGVEEGSAYGTPALRLKGKFFARLLEDGDSLVLKADFTERDLLMRADPKTFYLTDHYRNYPYVLVRLSQVRHRELADLLQRAWEREAPKRVLEAKGGAEVEAKKRRPRGRGA